MSDERPRKAFDAPSRPHFYPLLPTSPHYTEEAGGPQARGPRIPNSDKHLAQGAQVVAHEKRVTNERTSAGFGSEIAEKSAKSGAPRESSPRRAVDAGRRAVDRCRSRARAVSPGARARGRSAPAGALRRPRAPARGLRRTPRARKEGKRACRPDSVCRRAGTTVIRLGGRLPGRSSYLPARSDGPSSRPLAGPSRAYSVLLRMGFGVPFVSPRTR